MKCHYCEEEIKEDVQQHSAMRNKITNHIVYLHYPKCKVKFTTFHMTENDMSRNQNA